MSQFSFLCGEMKIENGKAKPNPDRGELVFFVNPDGLLCMQWKNLDKGTENEVVAILSEDWIWKKVPTAKGRVVMFQNVSDPTLKYLFWMQGDKEKDQEILDTITKIITNGSIELEGAGVPMSIDDISKEEQKQQNTQNQQQKTTSAQEDQSTMDFIKNLANSVRQLQKKYPDLTKILTTQNLQKLISKMNEKEKEEVVKLLPENQRNQKGLDDNISSPQFKQALEQLSIALNSENLPAVISSFGLNMATAQKYGNGVEAFIRCIIEKYSPK